MALGLSGRVVLVHRFIGRFVLLAKGLSFTGTGPPIMPYKFKEGGTNAPEVQHSSECHPDVWARAKAAKRLVVLGAGKAGCDILNFGCEPSWPNVTWVHRGMHLFLNRELTHAAMKDGALQMTMAIGELIAEGKKKEHVGKKTYEVRVLADRWHGIGPCSIAAPLLSACMPVGFGLISHAAHIAL